MVSGMNDEQIEAAAEQLGKIPTPSTAHMDEGERADGCGQMLADLLQLASIDGCIAAAWAYEWILARLAADRAKREERERPIAGNVAWLRSLGCGDWIDDVGVWYVEDEFGIGRLVEYVFGLDWWYCNGERIWQDSEPTRGQLLDLLAALGVERKGEGAK
jgi:hypothetical protein